MTIPCQSEQGASCREACKNTLGEVEIGADDRRTVKCLDKITSDFNYIVCRLWTDGCPYRSGRSMVWLKSKNSASEAVRRERKEDWGRYARFVASVITSRHATVTDGVCDALAVCKLRSIPRCGPLRPIGPVALFADPASKSGLSAPAPTSGPTPQISPQISALGKICGAPRSRAHGPPRGPPHAAHCACAFCNQADPSAV